MKSVVQKLILVLLLALACTTFVVADSTDEMEMKNSTMMGNGTYDSADEEGNDDGVIEADEGVSAAISFGPTMAAAVLAASAAFCY
ncbi:expressed unknown protein [Seminavis robusta]|uniref:Uncharacterized protein n=1 Tax=Seminavis robusta TaxID=568900 RepID=A0A9N8H4Q7_9STRA|nr:expressed unknown protein [Seminavis robusta]|eukprot:Sro121_g058720.1 n/a (86) ;mRNA; r:6747-7004